MASPTAPGPTPSTASKRLLGQYFTTANPFHHPAFDAWWATCPEHGPALEPFAGADHIPALLRETGYTRTFDSYDIEPAAEHVTTRDTLVDFPTGYTTVVTNPPYLARHFARRNGLDVDHLPWGPYTNLYQVALDRCLAHASHVAAIVPESFMTTALFRERLTTVIALTAPMFADTDTPTCLALFGPDATPDFDVWRGHTLAGTYTALSAAIPQVTPATARITFNRLDGQIGLRAIDDTTGPTIAFVPAADIDANRVKPTARLVTRIHVDDLDKNAVPAVLASANAQLADYRTRTADVHLTAFKGLRTDAQFRRRIDYTTARNLLALALLTASRRR